MILVTVGMQMPFDRLVRAVDAWAAAHPDVAFVAQIADTPYRPRHLPWTPFLSPVQCRRHMAEADLIVTHAGMGTILAASELGTPILVMPRRGHLRETRNDHQLGTARALAARNVTVAWDETELAPLLDRRAILPVPAAAGSHASDELLSTIRAFVRGDATRSVEGAPSLPLTPTRRRAA